MNYSNYAIGKISAAITEEPAQITIEEEPAYPGNHENFPTGRFSVVLWSRGNDTPIETSNRTLAVLEHDTGNTYNVIEWASEGTTDNTFSEGDYIAHLVTAEQYEGFAETANAMGSINHGEDADTERPTGYNSITWIGTVEPTNATNDDIWIDVS